MFLDLYNKRLTQRGSNNEEVLVNAKERSFKVALERAYNAETVEHKNETYKVIINQNKQKIDYDEKVVSAPNEMNLHVGSTLYVPRNETRWIVTTEHLGEKAYFKGDIKKAIYLVSWRDENNIKHSHWAAVRGPVETKLKSEPTKGNIIDTPNNSLTLWIGQTDGTSALKRYSYLMVADRVWEVAVTDDISQPGLVELQLIEATINRGKDDFESKIARDKKIQVTSIFDMFNVFKVNESISVNPNLYINDRIETDNYVGNLNILCDKDCIIDKDTITFVEEGEYNVTVEYTGIGKCDYKIKVESTTENNVEYIIEGSNKIKPITTTTENYRLECYIDGVEQEIIEGGEWSIDSRYAEITSINGNQITLKFTSTIGKTELKYIYNGDILATKEINIVSVFGV